MSLPARARADGPQAMHERIVMSRLSCNGCKKGFLGGRRPYNFRLWECPVKTLASLRRLLIFQPIATYRANYKYFMCTLWLSITTCSTGNDI